MAAYSPSPKQYIAFVTGFELFKVSEVTGKIVKTVGLPSKYLHVGVAIYNRLYHFGQHGIEISTDMASTYEFLKPSGTDVNYQLTNRTKDEFEEWVRQQQNTEYTPKSYNVYNKNCLCFVTEACRFLDISSDIPLIVKLKTWLANLEKEDRPGILEILRKSELLLFLRTFSMAFANGSRVEQRSVEVKGVTIHAFGVAEQLYLKFKLSNSGGVYRLDDGSLEV